MENVWFRDEVCFSWGREAHTCSCTRNDCLNLSIGIMCMRDYTLICLVPAYMWYTSFWDLFWCTEWSHFQMWSSLCGRLPEAWHEGVESKNSCKVWQTSCLRHKMQDPCAAVIWLDRMFRSFWLRSKFTPDVWWLCWLIKVLGKSLLQHSLQAWSVTDSVVTAAAFTAT